MYGKPGFHPLQILRHTLNGWLALMKYFRFKLISLDSTECIPEHHHENFCSAPLASLELICDALMLHSIPMHLSVSARYILEVIVAPAH